MSDMVHYIIANVTVLMEQYANDRGPGRGSGCPNAETLLAFGHSMQAENLPAF